MDKIDLLRQELDQVSEDVLDEVIDFVQFLRRKSVKEGISTAIASESSLRKDWLTPEEDAAWQHL